MATRFMTDPHAMRDMAGRFEVHAQTVEDEARRTWASAQNISGAGWSGMAEATSLDTMTQMNQAFRKSRVQRVATISPVAIANPAPGDNAARKTGRGGARQSPQSRVQRVATG